MESSALRRPFVGPSSAAPGASSRQNGGSSAERRKSRQRSKVTNGSALLPDVVDGRSATARRYRDLVEALTADQGGADQCSESRRQLIRRFASVSVLCEQAEAKLAAGEEIDVSQHALLCSTLTRLVTRLGLERRQKDITPPTVEEYIAHVNAQKGAAP